MKLLVAMNLSPRWIGNHGLDLQTEALARVGCKKALADKISGSRADAIDTGTPSGRFFFHVMASLAEIEHELAIERTRAGLELPASLVARAAQAAVKPWQRSHTGRRSLRKTG